MTGALGKGHACIPRTVKMYGDISEVIETAFCSPTCLCQLTDLNSCLHRRSSVDELITASTTRPRSAPKYLFLIQRMELTISLTTPTPPSHMVEVSDAEPPPSDWLPPSTANLGNSFCPARALAPIGLSSPHFTSQSFFIALHTHTQQQGTLSRQTLRIHH